VLVVSELTSAIRPTPHHLLAKSLVDDRPRLGLLLNVKMEVEAIRHTSHHSVASASTAASDNDCVSRLVTSAYRRHSTQLAFVAKCSVFQPLSVISWQTRVVLCCATVVSVEFIDRHELGVCMRMCVCVCVHIPQVLPSLIVNPLVVVAGGARSGN